MFPRCTHPRLWRGAKCLQVRLVWSSREGAVVNLKRWTRNGVVMASIVSVVGCSLPIEPKYDRKELAKKAGMAPMPTVKEVRNIADAWTTELDEATRNRHMQDLMASEVLLQTVLD